MKVGDKFVREGKWQIVTSVRSDDDYTFDEMYPQPPKPEIDWRKLTSEQVYQIALERVRKRQAEV